MRNGNYLTSVVRRYGGMQEDRLLGRTMGACQYEANKVLFSTLLKAFGCVLSSA